MAMNNIIKRFPASNTVKYFINFRKTNYEFGRKLLTKRHQPPPLFTHISNGIPTLKIFIPMGILSFFKKEEETPEEQLINTIKRGILAMQQEEYNKAEQMLHLALRMAQDLQNRDGITYIYDVMANLALESGQYIKATKLYTTVMQRLIQNGISEDDVKMLHISSKVAYSEYMQKHYEKAKIGFMWVLEKLNIKIKNEPDNKDLQELKGTVNNNYGHMLVEQNKYNEAKQCFLEAYETMENIYGKANPVAVDILNNLAVICTYLGDVTNAEYYMNEAIALSKNFPELIESGIYQANQGLMLMKKGLLDEARKLCTTAWRLAKNSNNENGMEQANYCIKQIEGMQTTKEK